MKVAPIRWAVATAFCAACVGFAVAQQPDVGWKDYLGGPEGAHYSPLKQINASNVNKLDVAWSYPAGDGNSVFCPLVVDNVAYISAKGGALVALDATTGKEVWVHAFGSGGGGRGGIGGLGSGDTPHMPVAQGTPFALGTLISVLLP